MLFRSAGKATLVPSSLPISDQAAMLEVHFGLMQTFLQQQMRVLDLMQTRGQQVHESETQSSLALAQEDKKYVLLGKLIEKDARKASWLREVTLETEPYLLHHAFGGYPSLRDITKTELPVIPFTFSMETTIEAALDLVAKPCVVQRVYDIRALQWFVYLGKPFGIDIKAQLLNDNTVLCRIYNIVDGQKNLSFESKVEINTQQIGRAHV